MKQVHSIKRTPYENCSSRPDKETPLDYFIATLTIQVDIDGAQHTKAIEWADKVGIRFDPQDDAEMLWLYWLNQWCNEEIERRSHE